MSNHSNPFLSLIVTTYNWPEALDKVLEALMVQTDLNFELLIADDGSGPQTTILIEKYQSFLPFPCKHIWQEDNGFRAAAIRNQALLQASGQYIVFLDGDCIPRRDFVEKHAKLAEAGYFVVGNRVLLSQDFTKSVLAQAEVKGLKLYDWSFFRWFWARCLGYCNRCLSFIALPLTSPWRKRKTLVWKGAKGCNLGIFKSDLIRINGFEENFTGWGYEDSDLVIRLLSAGIKRKEGRFALTVIHLWHKENDRRKEKENWLLLERVRHSKEVFSKQGLNQRMKVIL